MSLAVAGHALIPTTVGRSTLEALRGRVFAEGQVGTRCLLDDPLVRDTAHEIRMDLSARGVLPDGAKAIQAISFDKTPQTNWKVTWHQDLMFPFARSVTQPGFELPSKKDGIDYARPPREVLEEMLAVRLHVDDCDASNGPLRVSPGSHLHGILRSSEVPDVLEKHGETVCSASAGEALLMRPLLLHASSPAREPKHRRVLHFVFHSGGPIAEDWHRAV